MLQIFKTGSFLALTACVFLAGPCWSEDKESAAAPPEAEVTPGGKPGETAKDPVRPYSREAVEHYNRGHELHQSGSFNQAITEYKNALLADDRMEEAHTNLGLIYTAQRNYSKAMESFKKALALKPNRPNALNGLGTVLYAKNKFAEAMEKWQQAVQIDPNFASAYYNMGNALENEKELPRAVEAYVKAISINPSMSDAYYRVGSIYARQKHTAQATILLSKAVSLDPAAEFVHDAKRTLASLEGELRGNNVEEPQVQMNVMTPPPPSAEAPAKPEETTEKTPTPVEPAAPGSNAHEVW